MILIDLSGLIDPFFSFLTPTSPLSAVSSPLEYLPELESLIANPQSSALRPLSPAFGPLSVPVPFRASTGNPPTLGSMSDTNFAVKKNRHRLLKIIALSRQLTQPIGEISKGSRFGREEEMARRYRAGLPARKTRESERESRIDPKAGSARCCDIPTGLEEPP